MTARLLVGDVFDRMAELPDHSFDLILTSPPFLALRSYLPDDHPDKAKEIGSEATPAEFLDTLLELTAVWRRLLAPYGSLVVELGDTYTGSGGAGGDYGPAGAREGQPAFTGSASKNRRVHDPDQGPPVRAFPDGGFRQGGGAGWPLDKSLTGIPTLYTWSLAYGRNLLRQPLTARELLEHAEELADSFPDLTVRDLLEQLHLFLARHEELGRGPGVEIEPWRIRNLKPWIRTNPPVGALGDKERPATSYITVATLARDRWFDLDAVRSGHSEPGARRQHGSRRSPGGGGDADIDADAAGQNPAGAPPLDWVHTVDLILDNELDARAGKTANRRTAKGVDAQARSGKSADRDGNWSSLPELAETNGAVGARGHHLRRRLEQAGYFTTLDALDVSPKGYAGAHYAVWPPELCQRLIDEMCPRRVCVTCGEPSRRLFTKQLTWARQPDLAAHIKERREALGITSAEINGWFGYKEIAKNWERTDEHGAAVPSAKDWPLLKERLGLSDEFDAFIVERRESTVEYVGLSDGERRQDYGRGGHAEVNHTQTNRRVVLKWSDCGHNTWRPGHVLDPFAGSGTTLAVATGMGRNATGIDLDPRNADLARERCGMFLEIDERPTTEGVA